MKLPTNLLGFLLALAGCGVCAVPAIAAPPSEPCPVSYSQLELPLRHRGGMSTPMVQLSFTNETKKKIVKAKFGLTIVDSDGSKSPYAQGLTFSAGADPGKVTYSEWPLQLEKLDLEHQGETVYLKSASFEDGTTWTDDGNQRCRDEVYFGPK